MVADGQRRAQREARLLEASTGVAVARGGGLAGGAGSHLVRLRLGLRVRLRLSEP